MVWLLSSHPKVPSTSPSWKRKKYLIFMCICMLTIIVFTVISFFHEQRHFTFNTCPPTTKNLTEIPVSALHDVAPLNPSLIRVKVLNATDQHGAAQRELAKLKRLGFISGNSSVGNDDIYSAGTLTCQGQIRFGNNGLGAAAAVRLAYPCAQLMEDKRKDISVDIALGTEYNKFPPPSNAKDALHELTNDHSAHERQVIAAKVQCTHR